jgi:2-haloalkanoic acid dehalogenase type II
LTFKAIFADFYGTLVHEDDDILPAIYEQVRGTATIPCDANDIGRYWWGSVSRMYRDSCGDRFKTQRELAILSLADTISYYGSSCDADDLIQIQFDHWMRPQLYEDTLPFLKQFRSIPVYILSNIDTDDVTSAVRYHGIQVQDIITSETVRAYKPRPDMFIEALNRYQLTAGDVVHIGDSIMSDVFGANSVGIQTIWLNRLNKRQPDDIKPDYICSNLDEAAQILMQLENT